MKKSNDFSADVNTWLDFANYDLKTAKWNLEGKIFTSCCYACQQAAEKALKALILAKGKVAPKIHSLDRLVSELKNLGAKTSKIEKDAQLLDKYYISTRYPGQYGGPEGLYDKIDAESAITSAEKILNFVRKQIS
ncbi:HEPN domain-containing protein [Candidatus Microgenomates bacterium]|nr:HEPN domain-containing protein [Candidatus Microgenomates bacterium]